MIVNIFGAEDPTTRLVNNEALTVKLSEGCVVISTAQSTSLHLTWQLSGCNTRTEPHRAEGQR